jgi:hypothetical protein
MRLSLTFIAVFFFFLKSFARCNSNAVLGICTNEDVAFVDNAVEQMFYEVLGYPTDDWWGRELCSQECNHRCTVNQ